MIDLEYQHQLKIRVYYEDTDFSGLVYHANYLRFMERGRTEWLRHLGVQQESLLSAGFAFVVSNMNIKFHESAKMDDELEVHTRISRATPVRFVFSQTVQRIAESKPLISAEVTVAAIDTSHHRKKPVRLTQALESLARL